MTVSFNPDPGGGFPIFLLRATWDDDGGDDDDDDDGDDDDGDGDDDPASGGFLSFYCEQLGTNRPRRILFLHRLPFLHHSAPA